MSLDRWVRRKSKAAGKAARKHLDTLPDGLWTKCPKCGEILFSKELVRNLKVCNKCSYHFRLGWEERLAITADDDSFVEMDADLVTVNPLDFPEYSEKVARDTADLGINDPMITGTATIGGHPVVLGIADFAFRGASMGSVYGEKVVRAFERAMQERLPVVMVNASGGARMQEGLLSLMQMAKTSASVAQHDRAGLMYISVLTDPTTAGVHASYAMLADVIVAEPGALIGFAGERVAAQAQVLKRPPGFQSAEFQLEHGMVDIVLSRREIKDTLVKVLAVAGIGDTNAA